MNWISVDVALPRPLKKVLLYSTAGIHAGYLFVVEHSICWAVGYSMAPGLVTHWMPLPAAPATQENGSCR